MKPGVSMGRKESVGWWMASTGYIYIPVIFGRWQRDQITDTICLTPIGDSHCSLLVAPLFPPTKHTPTESGHSCPS